MRLVLVWAHAEKIQFNGTACLFGRAAGNHHPRVPDPTPSRETLREWFDEARIPRFKAWQDSTSVLRHLYGAGEKVLIFTNLKSQGQLLWDANRSDDLQPQLLPTGPEGVWFLPQPVRGGFFPNPRANGRLSRRSEEAVTVWRFAVLEIDEADADDWLRCLVQIPLQIASICESGGRSIHALVRVDATSKADWDRLITPIKPVLITLGADPGALSGHPAVALARGDARRALSATAVFESTTEWAAAFSSGHHGRSKGGGNGNMNDSMINEVSTWARNNGVATDSAPLLPPLAAKRLDELVANLHKDPAELLQHRFLCRGAGLLLVGPTGIGKSSLAMQAMMLWTAVRRVSSSRSMKWASRCGEGFTVRLTASV